MLWNSYLLGFKDFCHKYEEEIAFIDISGNRVKIKRQISLTICLIVNE